MHASLLPVNDNSKGQVALGPGCQHTLPARIEFRMTSHAVSESLWRWIIRFRISLCERPVIVPGPLQSFGRLDHDVRVAEAGAIDEHWRSQPHIDKSRLGEGCRVRHTPTVEVIAPEGSRLVHVEPPENGMLLLRNDQLLCAIWEVRLCQLTGFSFIVPSLPSIVILVFSHFRCSLSQYS